MTVLRLQAAIVALMTMLLPITTFAAVWGQPDTTSSEANQGISAAADTLSSPSDMFIDSEYMYVADTTNNRVLLFPVVNGDIATDASIVLGQPDMNSTEANNGGVSATTLSGPTSVFANDQYVYVSDTQNHRVLIYEKQNIQTNVAAVRVLGQNFMGDKDANSSDDSVNQAGFNFPKGIFVDNNRLFVADTGNNRVVYWAELAPGDGSNAFKVMGQHNFSVEHENRGVDFALAETLSGPTDVVADGEYIYVSDTGNNRIVRYDYDFFSDGPEAVAVYGQEQLFQRSAANRGETVSAQTLFMPTYLALGESGELYVADAGNHRIVAWDSFSGDNAGSASSVWGQSSMTQHERVDTSANSVGVPAGLLFDNDKLYVATDEHRIVSLSTNIVEESPVETPVEVVPEEPVVETPVEESVDEEPIITVPDLPQCQVVKEGTLFRVEGFSAVYQVVTEGYRAYFPNEDVFYSRHLNFDGVVTMGPDCLPIYPQADNGMTYRPGSVLVKVPYDPKVYAVTPGAVLRHIATEQVAENMYGKDWGTKVRDVHELFFGAYTIGEPITDASIPHDGQVVSYNNTLYYILDGKKHAIESGDQSLYVDVFQRVATTWKTLSLPEGDSVVAKTLMDR